MTLEGLIRLLDLGGTFVFAISGAVAAINRRLDIFGITVLAFVAGCFGGIARDLLIGAVPPAALVDGRYMAVSVAAALITFFCYAGVDRLRRPVLLFDAAGLAFFAVVGTQKALAYGLDPIMAAILGMLSAIGGGMVRDVLLMEIPQVLRAELYAVAALGAASVVVVGHLLGLPYPATALAGGLLGFVTRFMAIQYGWRLPAGSFSAQERAAAQPPDRDAP